MLCIMGVEVEACEPLTFYQKSRYFLTQLFIFCSHDSTRRVARPLKPWSSPTVGHMTSSMQKMHQTLLQPWMPEKTPLHLMRFLFGFPSLVVLTTALHAPPFCPSLHFYSGFATAVTHSSFSSHNHGGPVVWQDVEDESVSSGAGWAPSPAGIPTRSPPDRFDESPLPLHSRRKSWGFNQTHHCSIFQRSWRRTVGHFTNERCDISTSTSAQLNLTGCRCDSSFC